MKKRIWAILLAVCLAVGLLPTAAFAGGGAAVMIVCVYDETQLPDDYEMKNPSPGRCGLVQAFEKAKEYESNGTMWLIVIESDENFAGGSFYWPESVVDVSYLEGMSTSGYNGTYLSGTWTIPANVTLDFNNNGSHNIKPDDARYVENPTEDARTPLPAKIDLSGGLKNNSRVECGAVIHAGANLENTGLVIPENMELELDGDITLATSGTVFSVGKNASMTVNGTVTVKPPEDFIGSGSIDSFKLGEGAQMTLTSGSAVKMNYPCTIGSDFVVGEPSAPNFVKPSRPLLAGTGTVSFTHASSLETMTAPITYRFLGNIVERFAHNRDPYKDVVELGVQLEYNWDCKGAHKWVDTGSTNPTCTENGYSRKLCLGCQTVEQTMVSALGHDFPEQPDADGKYRCQREGCNAVLGTPPETSHKVTVPTSTPNGSVTLSITTAKKGDTVTITSTPNPGYQAGSPVVKDIDGNPVSVIRINDTTYTFTMPDADVNVEGVFTPTGLNGGYTAYSAADRNNRMADGYITVEFGNTGLGEVKANSTYLVQIKSNGQTILFLAQSDNTSLRFLCNKVGILSVWEVPNGANINIEDLTVSMIQNKQVITNENIAALPAYTKN